MKRREARGSSWAVQSSVGYRRLVTRFVDSLGGDIDIRMLRLHNEKIQLYILF